MQYRTILIAIRALSLAVAPLAGSSAGAAAPDAPKPTLIRLEMQPLDVPSALVVATNRCVTEVKAGDFPAADRSCNRAVLAAMRERAQSPFSGGDPDVALAAAYNNRAVLRYVSGQLGLAATDAGRARLTAHVAAIDHTAAAIDAARKRDVAGAD